VRVVAEMLCTDMRDSTATETELVLLRLCATRRGDVENEERLALSAEVIAPHFEAHSRSVLALLAPVNINELQR
jgi:hypothetical protein